MNLMLKITSVMMAINIALGAFGAHILNKYFDEYSMGIYEKAISYSFYNTLGLFAVVFIFYVTKNEKMKKAFYTILFGTLIFSISLYTIAITKITKFGMITPIGGALMIIGWVLVAIYLNKEKD